MDVERLVQLLDHPDQSEDWLHSLGVRNYRAAHAALARIAQSGMTLDLAAQMCGQLQQILPAHGNADMAIANLERFVSASRNPLALGTFWQRDHQALQTLLDIFSTSQHFSDLLLSAMRLQQSLPNEMLQSLKNHLLTCLEPQPIHLQN